jgi:hypothetical protein
VYTSGKQESGTPFRRGVFKAGAAPPPLPGSESFWEDDSRRPGVCTLGVRPWNPPNERTLPLIAELVEPVSVDSLCNPNGGWLAPRRTLDGACVGHVCGMSSGLVEVTGAKLVHGILERRCGGDVA